MVYRTLLRTIHKILNSRKRSDSSILCINAKTRTTRNLHEVLQARQTQRWITKIFAWLFYFPSPHRTLSAEVWWLPGEWRKQEQREARSGGYIKQEYRYIKISSTETSARVYRNTWIYSGCVMEKKHIVWAFWRVMCFFFMILADRLKP